MFDFVCVPCHGTTLHPATKGVNVKVYLIIHELKTHTLAEVDEDLLRGVKGFGGWVSLLYQNISSNTYIYIYIYHSNK